MKPYRLLGPKGEYQSKRPGFLGGHRELRIYGRLDCPSALRAIAKDGYIKHRVFFASEAVAKLAGYRPCARCMPHEYVLWKVACCS